MCSLTKAVKPLQIDWLGLLLALYSHAHQTVGRCSFLPTCPWTKPRCKQTRTHQNVKLAASVVCAFVLTLQGLKYYSCYFLLWCLRCWGSELFEKFFFSTATSDMRDKLKLLSYSTTYHQFALRKCIFPQTIFAIILGGQGCYEDA